jgi:rhomboid family GlyGly-CTERM serine protease
MNVELPLSGAQHNKWRICLGVALLALALMYWPHAMTHLRYDRAALSSGEWWRIATGHFVHLNMSHLLFNLLGLFLLCELLWRNLHWMHGLGMLVSAGIGTSAMLFWFHPELAWYAGLSGALHGLWAGCALAGLGLTQIEVVLPAVAHTPRRSKWRWPMLTSRYIFIAALILLLIKLGIELRHGPSLSTMQRIGGPVVIAGHMYGALAGICYALIWYCARLIRLKSTGNFYFRLK